MGGLNRTLLSYINTNLVSIFSAIFITYHVILNCIFHSLDLVLSFNNTDYTIREDEGPLEVVLTASRPASFEYSVTVTPTAESAIGELGLHGLQLCPCTSRASTPPALLPCHSR